jgi:hypothetical protein
MGVMFIVIEGHKPDSVHSSGSIENKRNTTASALGKIISCYEKRHSSFAGREFQINRTRDKTLDNYIQYVRTQKRIMYAQTKRHVLVDNFLCVVDEDLNHTQTMN